MSQISRQLAGIGLGVLGSCTLALLAAAPVLAADLAYPPYPGAELSGDPGPGPAYREERVEEALPPPPPPRPVYGPRFSAGPYPAPEECRTVVKRRIDEFGEEIVRRIRICDDAAYPPGPRLRPSFYRPPPPLPPADVPYDRWPGPPRW